VNRRTVFYWVIGILIAAVVMATAFHFDDAVRDFIAQHQNRVARNFMHNVSKFDDWPEHVALGLLLAAAAWFRNSKKWTRVFLSMLIALAIAGLAGRVIKISTGRARPSVKTEEVWNGPRFSSKFHAFPSGHVAASTAFFAVLFLASWRIGLICVPIPILIGIARMYVAAHYLSDVVCAAVLGVICAILVARLLLRNMEKANTEHRTLNRRRG
jgi:membrane-associated phospholipid phosphatase